MGEPNLDTTSKHSKRVWYAEILSSLYSPSKNAFCLNEHTNYLTYQLQNLELIEQHLLVHSHRMIAQLF